MERIHNLPVCSIRFEADLHPVHCRTGSVRHASTDDTCRHGEAVGLLRGTIRDYRRRGLCCLTLSVTLHEVFIVRTRLCRIVLVTVGICHTGGGVDGLEIAIVSASKQAAFEVEIGKVGTHLLHFPGQTHRAVVGSSAGHHTRYAAGALYASFSTILFEQCLLCLDTHLILIGEAGIRHILIEILETVVIFACNGMRMDLGPISCSLYTA